MVMRMFKVNDYVTRKSYNNDTVFKIVDIVSNNYILKGIDMRLIADSPVDDLVLCSNYNDSFDLNDEVTKRFDRDDFFYLPGKILHIDGDCDYLDRCLKLYEKYNVLAFGVCIKEENMKYEIRKHLEAIKPDILVITGHDAYYKKRGKRDDLNAYLNSSNFIDTVIEARKYERSHDKLVIIAGACGSYYEALIKNGANFASSPKRINIHALDPAIVALKVSLTEINKDVDIIDVIEKTKYKESGMGGITTGGTMYVGYPRV